VRECWAFLAFGPSKGHSRFQYLYRYSHWTFQNDFPQRLKGHHFPLIADWLAAHTRTHRVQMAPFSFGTHALGIWTKTCGATRTSMTATKMMITTTNLTMLKTISIRCSCIMYLPRCLWALLLRHTGWQRPGAAMSPPFRHVGSLSHGAKYTAPKHLRVQQGIIAGILG
jgi:hypothetical protein